jgi:hypothetical protein
MRKGWKSLSDEVELLLGDDSSTTGGARMRTSVTDEGSTVACVAVRARVARGPASRPGDACGAAQSARVDIVSRRLNEDEGGCRIGKFGNDRGVWASHVR